MLSYSFLVDIGKITQWISLKRRVPRDSGGCEPYAHRHVDESSADISSEMVAREQIASGCFMQVQLSRIIQFQSID